MAKTINRIGIIFLALVVSLLVVVGSVFATSVTSGDELNDIANDISINDIDSSGGNILQIDEVIEFNGTTCEQISQEWDNAIAKSITGKHIKVILTHDWTAPTSDDHAFATNSNDFVDGTIFVPANATITLDLNGFKIDRKLTAEINHGNVITIEGKLILMDNKYDEQKVIDAYNNDHTADLYSYGAGCITGGNNSADGGGVLVRATGYFEMNGGMVYNNVSYGSSGGGGITAYGQANVTINQGLIINNTAAKESISDGGGIVFNSKGTLNINGGFFHKNIAADTGGAISVYDNSTVNITGGIISENIATGWGCAIRANCYKFNMSGGIIEFNSFANDLRFGSGVIFAQRGVFNIDGGIVRNNSFYTGGAITIVEATVSLKGVKIYDNHSKDGAGVKFDYGNVMNGFNYGKLIVGAGTQIYNNTYSDEKIQRDVYPVNSKIEIGESLETDSKTTHIGVFQDSAYDQKFTYGYSMSGNRSTPPSKYFFSNQGKKIVVSGTEAMISEENSTATDLTWKWTGGQVAGGSNATVPYTGSGYVITATGNIYQHGVSDAQSSFTVIDAGSYVFYSDGDYRNPTFMFTIQPKEVNVVWGSTQLTYNGKVQVPTASIKEDSSCKVTVTGSGINAGVGYMATAIALSNKNYTIKYNTQSVEYRIAKAKVASPTGTAQYVLDGKEHTFTPTDFDNNLMSIVGNVASKAGEHTAIISLKDSSNYEWQSGGTSAITLKYTIEDKSMIKDGVYDYLYLESNGNSVVRKSYSQNGVYRVANDTDLISNNNNGKLIMGNILPETSVSEFMSNLYFEQEKLQVYNNKGEIITDTNANVGSGWKIVYDGTEEIYLSVLGDVTGDGRIDATDITYLRRIANGEIDKAILNPAVLLAAMVDNRGKITSVDAEILRAVCKYEITIDMYF